MHLLKYFFAPPDTALETGALTTDDILDELGKDEPVIEEEIKPEEDLLKEDKKEEKKELELEEEETDEEPELNELDTVEDVPRKEILKKYPTLFKEFPQLQTAYYREKKYAELLPTIEDAKNAVEKSEQYDKVETALLNGELDSVINSIKTADPRAFNKIVDNYLPLLAKTDQNAYYHVIGGVVKNTIAAMVKEAENIKNEDLKAAAVILNQFIFGKSEYEPPKSFGPGKEASEEETKLSEERTALAQERYESALDTLTTSSDNQIKATISKHIDPKDSMTDYVKRVAIKDAMEDVTNAIASDKRFKSTLDALWMDAHKNKYKGETLERIKKAYLSKAKALLPDIIQRRRNEALKGLGKRVSSEREEPEKKGPVSRGRSVTADNSDNKQVPKGMRSIDYLMQD